MIQYDTITKMIYTIDMQREVKICKLVWLDSFSSLRITNSLTLKNTLEGIEAIITMLESSTSKGFLSTQDLRLFPVFSEILPSFLIGDIENTTEFINGEKSMDSYKWLYNVIIVNLYLLCLEELNKDLTNEKIDVLSDLKVKESELYLMLDPSIRHHIQKRGISVKENIYIGFDTEFIKKDLELNELISTQLAVTTRTSIQIPRVTKYQISKIDEDTNELIKEKKNSSIFNYKKIETSIQMCINGIRKVKFEQHDVKVLVLTEGLKMIKGLNYFEHEEKIVFSLPRSLIQPYIHFGDSFSFKEIIQIASGIAKPFLGKNHLIIMSLLKDISSNNFSIEEGKVKLESELNKKYAGYTTIAELKSGFELLPTSYNAVKEDLEEKRLTRNFITDLFPQKVSVTKSRNYYIIAHFTPADLSMMLDFNEIKEDLSIVNGSFVTLGKPLKYCGRNIHIRDTMLLAPGGRKSLAEIGKLYGEALNKIQISKDDLDNMQGFLARDKAKFTEYALRDSLISLIHAAWMEDFNFKIGGSGIPLSLSALGRNYVKSMWKEESYPGYQISSKYLLGDVATSVTPKGLNVISDIGFVLPYYISNYKGGRNECFMYGVDRDHNWYDYDLSSAYTTIMSMAGHPEYDKCRRLSVMELMVLRKEEILYSYLIIHADFEFPLDTKYPSIPCYVDENCTIYPLNGSCVITGAEYLLALNQRCVLKIHDIFLIPFKNSEYCEHKPYASILKTVQEQRRGHAKGTISNMMYKEIGNSIYGSVVRGIGNKRKFDIKSKGTIRMTGDILTNPIIASWTTAFVRSVIGECLHSIQELGGLVVSVTTDGFLTNIDRLDEKLVSKYLYGEFKNIRMLLANENIGLELKNRGKGIIAWSTRGQLGIESKIIATTGFQHRVYTTKEEFLKGFLGVIKSETKTLEFSQSRLRTATEIYKKGGHVTMLHRDQLFRMHFDNRRVLEVESTIPPTIELLIDSKPLTSVSQGKNLRFISRLSKNKLYAKYTSEGKSKISISSRNKEEEVIVRTFIKGLLSTPPRYKLNRLELISYTDIIDYIQKYNPLIKITENSLAVLKLRINTKGIQWMPVKKSMKSQEFVLFVQQQFKEFDVDEFYGLKV